MRCPFCGHLEDKVVDSRASKEADKIRRRRECQGCERRYTTYERIEEVFPQIIKSDGSREEYDREKLWEGIRIACTKRPISIEEIDEVVAAVEKKLVDHGGREMSSDWIGSTVTAQMRDLDPVAYIRFASVYRAFSDIQAFLEELHELDEESDAHTATPETTGRQSCPDSDSKGANESTESGAG
jgi:transcriptional repressor NrdR